MKELNTVDLFCGAGGASTGLELALKRLKMRHVGIAINHWSVAVDTMRLNHPDIDTKQMSIETAVPSELVPGRIVDLLWASPSCTHHSRAKGGKPRSNQLRAQPQLILQWIDDLRVRRLIVENVPEFVDWGPLAMNGRPIERKKGECFRKWVESIEAQNYIVEWRIVNCADYGDATTRKRFFLKAVRRGCGKIRWPEPTHAENPEPDLFGRELQKWRGACECLDFSDTGKSIFGREKPLAENTLRRIMTGLRKYNGIDFQMDMMKCNGGDGSRLRPFVVRLNRCCDAEDIEKPISTITASGVHHMLCQPLVIDHFRNGKAQPISEPLGVQHCRDRYSVVTPLVMGQQACAAARPVTEPCPTIATSGAIRGIFPVLEDGRIIDIRIRMLKPSELAAAHSFPKDYILTGNRSDQVKQIGNSVPVRTAAAMCEADFRNVS